MSTASYIVCYTATCFVPLSCAKGTAASYIKCCVLQPVLCRGMSALPLSAKGAAFSSMAPSK